jgi:N-methylhydantoinase A/oxoprolinase/acetone carboxylase beta subunit
MPELREFERGSSMVINASVPPLVEGYLDAVARRLPE